MHSWRLELGMGSLKDLWGHHVVLSRASFSNFWCQFAKSHTVIRAIWYTITLLMLIPIPSGCYPTALGKTFQKFGLFRYRAFRINSLQCQVQTPRQTRLRRVGWWSAVMTFVVKRQSWVGILPWMWFWFIIHVCRQLDTYLRNVYFYTHMANGTVKIISQPCAD